MIWKDLVTLSQQIDPRIMEVNFDGIGGSTVGQNNVNATTTTAKTDNDKTNTNSNFFLANENLCGQTLLTLITKGHTICANIKMASERIPMAFIIAANLDGNSNNYGTRGGKTTTKNKGGGGGGLFSIFASSSSPSSGDTDNNKSQTKNTATDRDDETLSEVATKYSRFLFDFSYLHNPEEAEASLTTLVTTTTSSSTSSLPPFESEENNNVHELEREFTINHENSIIEFYNLFYSIYNYQNELHTFITDLITGYYIQYTVESVLLDRNGKILLCEVIWLLGIMLILMERLLPVSKKDTEIDSTVWFVVNDEIMEQPQHFEYIYASHSFSFFLYVCVSSITHHPVHTHAYIRTHAHSHRVQSVND
jgi:hypothetical protein